MDEDTHHVPVQIFEEMEKEFPGWWSTETRNAIEDWINRYYAGSATGLPIKTNFLELIDLILRDEKQNTESDATNGQVADE